MLVMATLAILTSALSAFASWIKNTNQTNEFYIPFDYLYLIGPQALHIHFLGLCFQGPLMGDNSCDNLGVEEDDETHGKGVASRKEEACETYVDPVVSDVVK